MGRRHPASCLRPPFPLLWLVTDERQGAALWAALAALPRGSGVLFRHCRTEPAERAAVFGRIVACARRHGLVVLREEEAAPRIVRVHSLHEAVRATSTGAALLFVSPVFATRTHPGQAALGPLRAARIARSVRVPAIALGGMTARRFQRLRALGFAGWAAIDGLTPAGARAQKRKAVPI